MESGDHLQIAEFTSVEDEKFDRIYPEKLRRLSSLHWTQVSVAAEAARMLVTKPATRVLDVGCGCGKFLLVAASLTEGHFTGIEQRADLVAAARAAAKQLQLARVEVRHGNVLDLAFAEFDAFYIFNPFEENMAHGHRIDASISLSSALFRQYTNYVSAQLGVMPLGTRVVTYAGYADEIPSCYTCEQALFHDDLKLWVKHREFEPEIERLGLRTSRSYRGGIGWVEPRPIR